MSRLTRDGAAEPVSRDQILRREQGQGNIHFPCSTGTTSRIGSLTWLILTLVICDDNTYIHTSSGCGKREVRINWSMVTYLQRKAAPVTGTTLRFTSLVPVGSR